ncbi:MAG: PIN domain-containing protein [Candidatus Cloacimonetes bacterium]|nr:PIN domain-containing protein [Candidatus Cloacimonadota bacterium]
MKKIYLDTSVLNVYLFERETARFQATQKLFELIRKGKFQAFISLHSPRETYVYCRANFPKAEVSHVFRLALRKLLALDLEILPLLTREKKSLWKSRLLISDSSDVPHVSLARISECDAIATYDIHFKEVADFISAFKPEELIKA